MNILEWFEHKKLRYYRAMMGMTQDEYLDANDPAEATELYSKYLYWKGKYEKAKNKNRKRNRG